MSIEKSARPLWQVMLGLAAILLLAGLLIYLLPLWLVPSAGGDPSAQGSMTTERSSLRTATAALVVGVGSLGALYFTARNSVVAVRALLVTQRSDLAERYSRAIDHLGSDSPDIVLGGIYSLEQLATESDRDHPAIVEILSAFVRRRVPSPRTVADDEEVERVPLEVQAALTVLGRLPHVPGSRADLSECRLDGVNLRRARLDWADLTSARFYRANLQGASLLNCDFSDTRFKGANLEDAKLSTKLSPATFDVGDFHGAELSGASFVDAELYNASFKDAILGETDFTEATLCNSSFENASTTGHGLLHLGKMQVDGPDAARTPLRGPMVVRGADMRGIVGLHQDNLDKATGDRRTRLSDPLHRPESW